MKNIIRFLVLLIVVFQFNNLMAAEKTVLSQKDMGKLLGTWQGKPIPSNNYIGLIPTLVFRFEMSKKGEFTGVMIMPEIGRPDMPLSDMEMSHGNFIFKIPDMKSVFIGKLGDYEIIGKLNMGGPSQSLILKKGEYVAPLYRLNLSDEIVKLLLGKWNGKLATLGGTLTPVFRFEKTKDGDFVGFINFSNGPRQEAKGVPFTDGNLSNGNLILKAEGSNIKFKGQLSSDKLEGEWTQGGMNNPITLTKEKP
jgi:hypothetical protein